jgi:hypothetical protein
MPHVAEPNFVFIDICILTFEQFFCFKAKLSWCMHACTYVGAFHMAFTEKVAGIKVASSGDVNLQVELMTLVEKINSFGFKHIMKRDL